MTGRLSIPDDVLSQEVNGETVLLNLEGEAYFALNEVGTHIWQLLQSGHTFAGILDTLAGQYDASREQLENDVGKLLKELVDAGLVCRADA